MGRWREAFFLLTLFPGIGAPTWAERPPLILDEAQVPEYELPPLLKSSDGREIADPRAWFEERRPEILALFETHMYGRIAKRPIPQRFEVLETDRHALGGLATRKQVAIHLGDKPDGPRLELLLYLPNDSSYDPLGRDASPQGELRKDASADEGGDRPRGVPVFLGLNFHGNHTIHKDEAIRITPSWVRNSEETGVTENRATEKSRGAMARRWPVEAILARGYGVATIYYGDIDPDYDDAFKNGVHALWPEYETANLPGDLGGSIAAWAWGLSRALDYLETDSNVEAKNVALVGHSRLGKTALWAGANDPRFAVVISNNSGSGGAALSRRCFGERIERTDRVNPHWFCDNFERYNDREAELPVDQHMLVALIAPRPVYVASASEDSGADPRGEFLGAKGAEPVYRLLGKKGLPLEEFPPPGEGAAGTIGYHLRPGDHDILEYDWQRYMDFADRHFGRPPAR